MDETLEARATLWSSRKNLRRIRTTTRTSSRFVRSIFLFPTGTAHVATGLGARVFAILQHLRSVDEHVDHAGRALMRLIEGCVVLNLCRIENQIGRASCRERV